MPKGKGKCIYIAVVILVILATSETFNLQLLFDLPFLLFYLIFDEL